jgi:Holliday junction resolvasome RuvABC endonuclease subunit
LANHSTAKGVDMRILGVRAAPKVASFIVYCTESKELKCVDVINIPQTLNVPEQLKYVRNNILDILREFDVSLAAIRVCEASVQKPSVERLYIEGVIQEAFSSSNVKDYFILRKQGIYSRIGINSKQYDDVINGKLEIMKIKTSKFNQATNEAILSALAAGENK